jgi:hypothetical protein
VVLETVVCCLVPEGGPLEIHELQAFYNSFFGISEVFQSNLLPIRQVLGFVLLTLSHSLPLGLFRFIDIKIQEVQLLFARFFPHRWFVRYFQVLGFPASFLLLNSGLFFDFDVVLNVAQGDLLADF